MVTLSTLSTPIATPIVGKDGKIDPVWNEFFVRFMMTAGIKVSIDDLEADTTNLQAQIDSIDVEAAASITMSDSDSNSTATLAVLYDGNRTSDGVGYTLSGTDKYIEYQFGMRSYVDRISIWTADANARVYVAYSDDGISWSYLSAEADHTLDSEGRLVTATSQSNAALDYWPLATGQNNALFPNNISALYIRLYMTGTYSTTIYELIPSRMLIAELASIGELSAITADVGLLKAGRVESANGNTYFDLDNNVLVIGNASGYDNITDAPQTADIVNFSTVESAGVLRTGNTIEKTGVGGAWDGQSYSTVGYNGGVRLSFTPNQIDKHVMVGLDENPSQDAGYANIDYCFYCDITGALKYRESGSGSTIGTYVAGDLLELVYTGAQIIYYQNGTALRSSTVAITNPLYMDSSFLESGTKISNVIFGPYADITQTALDAGAAIDNAIANGVTLISGGYIRTTLLHTDVLIVGGNAGDLAVQDRADLDYTNGADVTGDNTAADITSQGDLATRSTVNATYIDNGSITTDKLDALAVTADKIAANTITAAKIAANAVDTSELNADAVTADKIAANTITASEIAADAITVDELAANAVVADNIVAETITTGKLIGGAITQTVLTNTTGTTAVSASWVAIQSRSITVEEGGYISITAGSLFQRVTTTAKGELQLRRGTTTVVAQSSWEQNFTDDTGASLSYSENLASGSVTYYLYAKSNFSVSAAYRWIRICEFKK